MFNQEPQESSSESNHNELSDQYYKSRKQLMLYSVLFFILKLWEII